MRGKNKEVITGAAEKVSVALTVIGDEWVTGDESDRAESGSRALLSFPEVKMGK
ncbi:hypothetical protein A2U01_0080833 [Trifolium medium]|uniref:Uncharacterized protein n=1 Tax=Trifolium medium TaxID=97028 RepID=A0A392TF00_9FABA|nr:hypothetical protein [Trifolium medium]